MSNAAKPGVIKRRPISGKMPLDKPQGKVNLEPLAKLLFAISAPAPAGAFPRDMASKMDGEERFSTILQFYQLPNPVFAYCHSPEIQEVVDAREHSLELKRGLVQSF